MVLKMDIEMDVECMKPLDKGCYKCVLNDVDERCVETIQHS
jgi:hypothetical protein